jgi:hypothetical protein
MRRHPVPVRGAGFWRPLVPLAGWIGSVSALVSPVGSAGSSGTDRSGSDTYCHSTAHGRDGNVTNANARTTNSSSTTAPCEGVSRNHRNTPDANDS